MDKLKPEVREDLKTLAGKLDNWRELRRISDELHRLTERAEKAEAERDALREDAELWRWSVRNCYVFPLHGSICGNEQSEDVALWIKPGVNGSDISKAIDKARNRARAGGSS